VADTDSRTLLAYGLLSCTIVIWASAFSGLEFVLDQIDPYSLSVLRLLTASATLVAAAAALRVPLPEFEDLPLIAGTGLLAFSLYHLTLNFGLSYANVGAGQSSFIISTTPIWTTLLAWYALDESITYRTWIGLALGLGGVGWLSLDPGELSLSIGSLVVLGAALCNGAQLVLQKRLLERYESLHLAIYLTVIGSMPMLALLPWTIEPAAALDTAGWIVTLYLGIFPVALGYFLNAITLSIIDASRMSQGILVIPPVATVIAWWTLGEVPSTRLYVAGPMILVGVLLGQLDQFDGESAETPEE